MTMHLYPIFLFTAQFLFLLIPCYVSAAEDSYHGYTYYSGEYNRLHATELDAWGFKIKDREVKGIGSKAGFYGSFGNSTPTLLGLDLYSTNSMIPTKIGQGPDNDRKISLDYINLQLGLPIRKMPTIRYIRNEFGALGIVDGTELLKKDGDPLNTGDKFELGITTDMLLLNWDLGEMQDYNPYENYEGFGLLYGIGVARVEFLGVEHEYSYQTNTYTQGTVEKTVEGYGIGISMSVRYGTKPITRFTKIYISAKGDLAATKVGGYLKTGYEIGFLYRLDENLYFRPYAGGYFWPIVSWVEDFSSAKTGAGYSMGLSFEYTW